MTNNPVNPPEPDDEEIDLSAESETVEAIGIDFEAPVSAVVDPRRRPGT